jgi:hypothetical protein
LSFDDDLERIMLWLGQCGGSAPKLFRRLIFK